MSIAPVLSYQMAPCPDPERGCGSIAKYTWAHSSAPENIKTNPAPVPVKESSPDEDAVGFGDLLDIINPLQHLPVIGWAYREMTGDTIKPVPAMIGGAVFGGGLGLLSSAVQLALQENKHSSTTLVLNNQDKGQGQASGSARMMTGATPATDRVGDQLAAATPTYRAFGNREQTAGRIAVYA